ncbi:hypothetical protein LIER_29131 [Lithospermum erythrorhizon]|uniref:Uncharacterized protein n=1 Tax=Lithospermum erythrorhizon TaxID=34254 RepID=A0AAV3RMB2_LITER
MSRGEPPKKKRFSTFCNEIVLKFSPLSNPWNMSSDLETKHHDCEDFGYANSSMKRPFLSYLLLNKMIDESVGKQISQRKLVDLGCADFEIGNRSNRRRILGLVECESGDLDVGYELDETTFKKDFSTKKLEFDSSLSPSMKAVALMTIWTPLLVADWPRPLLMVTQ